MIIRSATNSDALDVLEWRNDPMTRAMSRSSHVVEERSHIEWFAKAVTDPRHTLLIGEVEGSKVGLVRFDHGDITEVSIFMNPAHRGRGYGLALLLEALKFDRGEIVAEIRPENIASLRIFEQAGFEFQDIHDGLRRYVRFAP